MNKTFCDVKEQSAHLCDVRSVKCPLAFVTAKQALLRNQTKVFLFGDEVSADNFCQYLSKLQLSYNRCAVEGEIKVDLLNNQRK